MTNTGSDTLVILVVLTTDKMLTAVVGGIGSFDGEHPALTVARAKIITNDTNQIAYIARALNFCR
jgi:hypothetical protein